MEFIKIEIREEDGPVARRILEEVGKLHWAVHQLREEVNTMATGIVTRDQFLQALKDGVTTIISKIDDLAAKVAAGTVTTPEDFTNELNIFKTAVTEALTKDPDAPAAGDGSTGTPTT